MLDFDEYMEDKKNEFIKNKLKEKEKELAEFTEKENKKNNALKEWKAFVSHFAEKLDLKYTLDKYGKLNIDDDCFDLQRSKRIDIFSNKTKRVDIFQFFENMQHHLIHLNGMLRSKSSDKNIIFCRLNDKDVVFNYLSEKSVVYIEYLEDWIILKQFFEIIIDVLEEFENKHNIFIQFKSDMISDDEWDCDGGIRKHATYSNMYIKIFKNTDKNKERFVDCSIFS